MAMTIYVFFAIGIVWSLFYAASAIWGTATFYTNYVPSACYGNQNNGVMIAAASDPLWNNGAICGKIFRVTCIGATNSVPKPCTGSGNSVTVKIVDHCPRCNGTLDLSKEAFATIAKLVAGALNLFGVAISWNLWKSYMNSQESGMPRKIISFNNQLA